MCSHCLLTIGLTRGGSHSNRHSDSWCTTRNWSLTVISFGSARHSQEELEGVHFQMAKAPCMHRWIVNPSVAMRRSAAKSLQVRQYVKPFLIWGSRCQERLSQNGSHAFPKSSAPRDLLLLDAGADACALWEPLLLVALQPCCSALTCSFLVLLLECYDQFTGNRTSRIP